MAELSSRYATALFNLALEDGNIDALFEQAAFVKDQITKNADIQKIINHPQIILSEKQKFFEDSLKDSVNSNLLGVIDLLLRKNRESYIVPTLEAFIKIVREHKGISTAEVFSAEPLTDGQLETLKAKLAQKLNKQIELVLQVDPSLIGGLRIRIDGYIIDSTIKSQMNNMKEQLLKTRLA